MKKITVLTTTPSISNENNVSGISNLTRLLIKYNTQVKYIVFTAGKKDKKTRNVSWFITQPIILINYIFRISLNKSIDIVHINMPLQKFSIIRDSWFVFISFIFKKPIIIHLRGGRYNLRKKEQIPSLFRIMIKFTLSKANQIIVLGDKESFYFQTHFTISRAKILTLPNCVKIPPEVKRPVFCSKNRMNILYLGRLDKNKGLLEIIMSLRSLPAEINYLLKIAGDGPAKEWFIKECRKNIPENFEYHGIVSGKAKEQLYLSSHIFLLPSYFEGLPNALLEAMSYGIMPIVTAVGSISEIISHNNNGIIVEQKHPEMITDALTKLYNNPLQYSELCKNASQTIINKFSIDNYIFAINKMYNQILQKEV